MDLISRLLVQEPTMRLSIPNILRHPWLCEVKLYKNISPMLQCFFRLVEMKAKIKVFIEAVCKNYNEHPELGKHYMIQIIDKLEDYGYSTQYFFDQVN